MNFTTVTYSLQKCSETILRRLRVTGVPAYVPEFKEVKTYQFGPQYGYYLAMENFATKMASSRDSRL